MRKINFVQDVLPHLIAVAAFLLITFFFFSPAFFDNKTLEQHDIQQFSGSAKAIDDFRAKNHEEPLWTNNMFSGMPAYLISVKWSNQAVAYVKAIASLGTGHPYANIFLAFVCYYIMLLAFRVRPYLAIGGAIAFGLSTYMIVGLTAGHNARIGAIAFMPLVMAGIHLAYTKRLIIGLGVTAMGVALQLRENHIQITYYLFLILIGYGIIRLIEAVREKQLPGFMKTSGLIILAAVIGASSFFGPLWAITDYTKYSTRGFTELVKPGQEPQSSGLTKEYAFAYNYGILEPMTLLIPQFYGGASTNLFVQNQNSASYQALVQSNDNQLANQLANYTSAYWGPQAFTAAPYYAGAIIVFMFLIGIFFAKKEYVWWLVPLSILSIMLSWGDSFKAFNYFMFDYFPGYNKFRSVSFALVIILFAMPLLGFLGVEKLIANGLDKANKKKLLIAFGIVGGLCLILWLFGGALLGFSKDMEQQLPPWFLSALADDRASLLKADAFRSFAFIAAVFILLYFNVHKKISPIGFYVFIILMITIDLSVVNKRYLTENNFKRKRENTFAAMTEADQEILKDQSYFRVYNHENPMGEARTSYYHQSVGGYHGAKLRRFQDFYDSCISLQHRQLITDVQQGQMDLAKYSSFNMLNVKYIVYGPQRNNIIINDAANGPAWFVNDVIKVNNANEELEKTCGLNTRTTAVIDVNKFPVSITPGTDSAANITLTYHTLNYLKYETQNATAGLAVFSEIFYPDWKATIDGKEATLVRANYLLRALEIPEGNHTVEFRFEPKPYAVGNKITMVGSWLTLFVLLGSIFYSLKRPGEETSK
jgi:hypothetical protein